MILAVDIGNTNIVIGGVNETGVIFDTRIITDKNKTTDEYVRIIKTSLSSFNEQLTDIEGSVVSSVVPCITNVVSDAIKILTGKNVVIVGHKTKTEMELLVDDPSTVGVDLIVGSVAAKEIYKSPVIVIDMGTATTVSLVDENGNYTGVMIIPGLIVSLKALSNNAEQLPKVNLSSPKSLFGKNTLDSMNAGSIIGCAAMIDGIIYRTEKQIGYPVNAVITGGLSSLVVAYCEHKINIEPDLILKGLYILYKKNK